LVFSFILLGSVFTVDERYTFIKRIGYGAYGVVCSAKDAETPLTNVAIKKIPKAFQDLVDAKRVLREIKILSKV
jgi:serine/threonine protein kinase